MEIIASAFWFFLPAGIANVSPVLANKIPFLNKWNTPLDLRQSWHGQRLLGDNKRVRGLVFGVLTAGLTALLLSSSSLGNKDFFEHSFLSGLLLGSGALVGDAIESFFKRRRDMKPGELWFPYDQIDYIVGGLVFVYPLTKPVVSLMVVVLVMYFGLHLIVAFLAYKLGLKPKPI